MLDQQVQRELTKIASEFCVWLKSLPGENQENVDPELLWSVLLRIHLQSFWIIRLTLTFSG